MVYLGASLEFDFDLLCIIGGNFPLTNILVHIITFLISWVIPMISDACSCNCFILNILSYGVVFSASSLTCRVRFGVFISLASCSLRNFFFGNWRFHLVYVALQMFYRIYSLVVCVVSVR